jgi:hypothetical protein
VISPFSVPCPGQHNSNKISIFAAALMVAKASGSGKFADILPEIFVNVNPA